MTDGRHLTDQRPDGRSRADGICLATETDIRAGRVPDIPRFGKASHCPAKAGNPLSDNQRRSAMRLRGDQRVGAAFSASLSLGQASGRCPAGPEVRSGAAGTEPAAAADLVRLMAGHFRATRAFMPGGSAFALD